MLVTNMAKQYVDFRGNPTKSAEEIGTLADQYIQQIYSGKQGNPLSGGIPAQGGKPQAAPAGGGVPMIYDSVTGEMVPYKR
ncbi:hypothetical protein D3C87_1183770 [compost metagenome]